MHRGRTCPRAETLFNLSEITSKGIQISLWWKYLIINLDEFLSIPLSSSQVSNRRVIISFRLIPNNRYAVHLMSMPTYNCENMIWVVGSRLLFATRGGHSKYRGLNTLQSILLCFSCHCFKLLFFYGLYRHAVLHKQKFASNNIYNAIIDG